MCLHETGWSPSGEGKSPAWETSEGVFKRLPVTSKERAGRSVGCCKLWSDVVNSFNVSPAEVWCDSKQPHMDVRGRP